jgi:hypothetical protein
MLVSESINQFVRGKGSKKGLGVGEFRNQIDMDNLPKSGLWKALAGNEDYMDDALIYLYGGRVFMAKNWDANGGEWARTWSADDILSNLREWIEVNDVFNLIPLEIIDETDFPGWDNIKQEYVSK